LGFGTNSPTRCSGKFQVHNLVPLIQRSDGDGDVGSRVFNFAAQVIPPSFIKYRWSERNSLFGWLCFSVPFWGNFVFCGVDFFWDDCKDRDRQMPEGTNQRIQPPGAFDFISVTLTEMREDLVLGSTNCNSLFFLSNQGRVNPLFNFLRKITSLKFGAFPGFHGFHIGQLIRSIYLSINRMSAQNYYY